LAGPRRHLAADDLADVNERSLLVISRLQEDDPAGIFAQHGEGRDGLVRL
jgi:hypothetical protein